MIFLNLQSNNIENQQYAEPIALSNKNEVLHVRQLKGMHYKSHRAVLGNGGS